jgi:hypothetical protein
MLFAGALTKTLSFLKVGMLGCMAMDIVPPYGTAFGGISYGCLSLGFLSGMGPLVWQVVRSGPMEELVYEESPAPSTHRARL